MRAAIMAKSVWSALAVVALGACGGDASDSAAVTAAHRDASLPLLIVYKNESCGCCGDWVKHMEAAGFKADVRNVDNMNPIKASAGIPPAMGSCHTAFVGKYFVEGHVPADDVKRLLNERPDAKGLTVPRMPVGSPGMESPTGEVEPYEVFLVANDGGASVYARHGQ